MSIVRRNTVSSGDQEQVDYYAKDESIAKSKDEYYSQSKSKAKANAKWLGSLKDELGLETEVIQGDFKQIAYGRSPDDSMALRKKPIGLNTVKRPSTKDLSVGKVVNYLDEVYGLAGEERGKVAERITEKYQDKLLTDNFGHVEFRRLEKYVQKEFGKAKPSEERLFHDICTSPNKSITIAGLVLGETDIIDAYNASLERFAKYIEKTHGGYRQRGVEGDDRHGDRAVIHNGKMLFAALNHYTARPVMENGEICVDPQLHTHLLAMNTTLDNDGRWRSLFHEDFVSDRSLDKVFDQILAEEVQGKGFAIRETANGFELADITDEQIEVFSKRTKQAEEALNAKGEAIVPGAVHNQARKLRRSKVGGLTHEDLEEMWKEQAKGMSVSKCANLDTLGHDGVSEELQYAINHLSERCVRFTESELRTFTFTHVQKFSVEEYDAEIKANTELIPISRGHYTTPSLLKTELEILDKWKSGLNKVQPLVQEIAVEDLMQVRGHNHNGEPISLSLKQATAIKSALESRHQFNIVEGLPGVGKTTAMAELLAQVERSGAEVELFGFASTHEAKNELEKSLALKSRTVASLVTSGAEGKIWIVDESGMNSNREWDDVLTRAREQGVRVFFVGDSGQNSSVEAGSPFMSVKQKYQEMGCVHRLGEIIRQKDEKQLKAVELIANGKGVAAIELLTQEEKLKQLKDRNARTSAIAKAFCSMPAKKQEQAIIVSGTNVERRAITEAVRELKKEDGTLGDCVNIKRLESRNLTKQEAKLGRSYEAGDYVRFHRAPRSSYLKSGELYKVNKIDGNKLHIETERGRHHILDLKKYSGDVEALRSQNLDVAVGDRIKFTSTIKSKGWYNGSQMDVVAVSGEWIKAKDKDGKVHTIDTLTPVGIDHDWVGTSYGRQGKTAQYSFVSLTNDPTSSRESTTVSISRQTHDIMVFAEDANALNRWVQKSNRQPNVLESLDYSDRTIEALNRAIFNYEKTGGKASEHVEKELLIAGIQTRLDEIGVYQRIIGEQNERNTGELHSETKRINRVVNRDQGYSSRVEGRYQKNLGRVISQAGGRGKPSGEIDRADSRIEQSDRIFDSNGENRVPESRPNSSKHQSDSGEVELRRIAKRIIEIATEKRIEKPLSTLRSQIEELTAIKAEVEGKRLAIAENLDLMRKHGLLKTSDKPKPVKIETFWVPEYQESDRPDGLSENHWREMQKSGIYPGLVKDNIFSIAESAVTERLLDEEFLKPEYGSGKEITTKMIDVLDKYHGLAYGAHWCEPGGWWGTAGTDARSLLTDTPAMSMNGVFKGNRPRLEVKEILQFKKPPDGKNFIPIHDVKKHVKWSTARQNRDDYIKHEDYCNLMNGEVIAALLKTRVNPNKFMEFKAIKYENPKGRERPVFLANIPDELAQKIYKKHGIEPTKQELEKGFWHIVRERNLPVTLIEGYKKALSALSQGVIAIGTPGVALYRSKIKDEFGKSLKLDKRELMEEIAVFATPGRQITFAFDRDDPAKTKTIWNVRRDMVRSAELLAEAGCNVKIAKWDYRQGKGCDDLIMKSGASAFLKALQNSQPWESEAKIWYKAEFNKLNTIARRENPIARQERIDMEVFNSAIKKGDRDDGLRFIQFSNGAKAHGERYGAVLSGIHSQYLRLKEEPELDTILTLAISQGLNNEYGVNPQQQISLGR